MDREVHRVVMPRGSVVRREFDSPPEFSLGCCPVPVGAMLHQRHGDVRFGDVGVEFESLLGCCTGLVEDRHIVVAGELARGEYDLGFGQARKRGGEAGVAIRGGTEAAQCSIEHDGRPLTEAVQAFEVVVVGDDVRGLALVGAAVAGELEPQGARDALGDLVLDGEDVFDGAVVALGPDVAAVGDADVLDGDTEAVSCLLHAAFQHRIDVQLLANLFEIVRGPLEAER